MCNSEKDIIENLKNKTKVIEEDRDESKKALGYLLTTITKALELKTAKEIKEELKKGLHECASNIKF